MKSIKFLLLSICAVGLLTTTGCIFPGHRGGDYHGEGYRGHGERHEHAEYRTYPEPEVNIHVRAD